MKKISTFVGFAVLAVILVAVFIWWNFPAANKRAQENEEQANWSASPQLFAKDDYQVEQRTDGQYIVIAKVGFSAKVPDGWNVVKQKTADMNEQYWVDLFSPDATDLTKKSYMDKGCGISISAGIAEENNRDVRQQIQILKNGASTSTSTGFQKGNDYEVIQLGQYEALQWLSTEKPIIGQFTGNYVPIDNTRNINFDTTFPVGYKEKCQPIWEDFVKTIKLE